MTPVRVRTAPQQRRRLAKILALPSEKKDLVVSNLEPSENAPAHKFICEVAAWKLHAHVGMFQGLTNSTIQ